jgi:hypothetical protein
MAHRLLKQHDDQRRDFDFLLTDEGWHRLATKMALTERERNHHRRAYDNVHYVPVLAA